MDEEDIMWFGTNEILLKMTLQWRHNGRDGISNHQHHDCLLNRLFRHRSKKTSEHRITSLCEGNSPVTGEFPPQRASNAENVSIWWSDHEFHRISDIATDFSLGKKKKINLPFISEENPVQSCMPCILWWELNLWWKFTYWWRPHLYIEMTFRWSRLSLKMKLFNEMLSFRPFSYQM